MLTWTLKALEAAPSIDGIVVVIHRADMAAARRMIQRQQFRKILQVVPGGVTRMASVYRGLQALPPSVRWVVVHDGARPLATPKLIEAAIEAALKAKAAITAVPIVPTVKQADRGWVTKTLDRNHLWAVQTPQVFHRDLLERAHAWGNAHGVSATDDAALVEGLGHRVRLVPGDHRNLKVTTREDLIVAEAFLKSI